MLIYIKAGDVETNPGTTITHKQVWICDICHKQIHGRKHIWIRCNRIEQWVQLRCAIYRYLDLPSTQRIRTHNSHRHNTSPPDPGPSPYPLPTYIHRNPYAASSVWSPIASSTSINKLQVMQNAALRTATGCTQDINIQHLHDENSHFPYTSNCSSTSHNTNIKHNIHHIPYTNTQHTSTLQGEKKQYF